MFRPHRFIFLDGLRGIAALAVLFYHASMYDGHPRYFASASLAVDLFFCLSGFVIAWNYMQKLHIGSSVKKYLIKRLIRLYPMYLIGIALGIWSLFELKTLGAIDNTIEQIVKSGILNSFYLPYFSGEVTDWGSKSANLIFPTNPASWSLLFELVANLLFIITVAMPRKTIVVLTLFFGIWLVQSGINYDESPGWSTFNWIGGFPRVGYSFMFGVLIFKFYDELKLVPKLHPIFIVIILVCTFLVPAYKNWIYYWALAAIFLMPLIVIFGAQAQVNNPWIIKALEYLGWISYPIYCVHEPLIRLVHSLSSDHSHFYRLTAIILLIVWLVAHITGKWLDEPIRAWLNKAVA